MVRVIMKVVGGSILLCLTLALASGGFGQAVEYRFEQHVRAGEAHLNLDLATDQKHDEFAPESLVERLEEHRQRTVERLQKGLQIEGKLVLWAEGNKVSETFPTHFEYRFAVDQNHWHTPEGSIVQTVGNVYLFRTHIRFGNPAGQLVLLGRMLPGMKLVSEREGGALRLYSMQNPPPWGRGVYEMLVQYASPGSDKIERVSGRFIEDHQMREQTHFEVSGRFGTEGYQVIVDPRVSTKIQVEGPITLTFIGKTNDFFTPSALPQGTLIRDTRRAHSAGTQTVRWQGEFPPLLQPAPGAPPWVPYILWGGGLLLLGLVFFFWRWAATRGRRISA